MSDQERNAIIGETMTQHGNQKVTLAALEAKAHKYAQTFRAMAEDLSRGTISSLERMDVLPTGTETRALLEEIRDTRAEQPTST